MVSRGCPVGNGRERTGSRDDLRLDAVHRAHRAIRP
jgi:hypothetical protein